MEADNYVMFFGGWSANFDREMAKQSL